MDYSHAVRIIKRIQYADHYLLNILRAQRAIDLNDIPEGLPLDIFHNDIRDLYRVACRIFQLFFA